MKTKSIYNLYFFLIYRATDWLLTLAAMVDAVYVCTPDAILTKSISRALDTVLSSQGNIFTGKPGNRDGTHSF